MNDKQNADDKGPITRFFDWLFETPEPPTYRPLPRLTAAPTARPADATTGGGVSNKDVVENPTVAKPEAGTADEKKPADTPNGVLGLPEIKPYVPPPDQPMRPAHAGNRAELIGTAPKIYVSADAYKRMCLYVELAPKEVGWIGTIVSTSDGDFFIEEVFLIDQEVTPVETELSAAGVEQLVLQFLEGGDAGLERANKLHFWGHSHVRMGTGPSGTDESTMRRFASEGHDFYVRGIFNKLGRGVFDVYYYRTGFRILDVEWAVIDSTGKVLLEKPLSSYGQFGISSFGLSGPSTPPPLPLPAELVPDQALRDEVTAEYGRKVRERTYGFFGGKKTRPALLDQPFGTTGDTITTNQVESEPAAEQVGDAGQDLNGECIPAGDDVVSPAKPIASENKVPQSGPKAGASQGFWSWLFSAPESPQDSTKKPQK